MPPLEDARDEHQMVVEHQSLVPLDDIIESFSEDVIVRCPSQDPIQTTLDFKAPCDRQDLEALQDDLEENEPPRFPVQDLQVAEVAETSSGLKRGESARYGNVIDVTDDALQLDRGANGLQLVQPIATEQSEGPMKPLCAGHTGPNDRPGHPTTRPGKRRRPAMLSQHLQRLSHKWQPQSQRSSQKHMTASQRLCAGIARRSREKRRMKGWNLETEGSATKPTDDDVVSPVTRPQAAQAFLSPSTPERPNVLFTGFSRRDLHQLKQSVNCLGGSAVRDLPGGLTAAQTRVVVRCTTVSTPEGSIQIAGARTIKYLDAVLAGAWVLSPDWVHASMRAGHWLAEGKFELQGDTQGLGGPPKGRQHGPELFSGFRFHFMSQVSASSHLCNFCPS